MVRKYVVDIERILSEEVESEPTFALMGDAIDEGVKPHSTLGISFDVRISLEDLQDAHGSRPNIIIALIQIEQIGNA